LVGKDTIDRDPVLAAHEFITPFRLKKPIGGSIGWVLTKTLNLACVQRGDVLSQPMFMIMGKEQFFLPFEQLGFGELSLIYALKLGVEICACHGQAGPEQQYTT